MLECQSLTKTYQLGPARTVEALKNVSLTIPHSQFVVVVGENGAGKSTLFDLIIGAATPDSGRIFLDGMDVSSWASFRRSRWVTRIHQSRESGLPHSLTVSEVLKMLLMRNNNRDRSRKLVLEAKEELEQVKEGLSSVIEEQMWHLSGGEHQLVSLAVARLLCRNRETRKHLLLLDEHVSQLDPTAKDSIMEATFRTINQLGITALMSTHDADIATSYGSRQIILRDGQIAEDLAGMSRITDPQALKSAICGL